MDAAFFPEGGPGASLVDESFAADELPHRFLDIELEVRIMTCGIDAALPAPAGRHMRQGRRQGCW